jgi:LAO/AO transport system kinase
LSVSAKKTLDLIRSGNPRDLARAISTVENHAPGWIDLLKDVFPYTGNALTIGLTGAPGAGKSTIVDQLAKHYREAKNPQSTKTAASGSQVAVGPSSSGRSDNGHMIGIIAVDPTSPYTGGAILGDRIRMQQHFSDPGIYIRSMATRGSLGGLARTTADVALVLDAAGRDLILIETVGVGQDEIDIVRLADVTVVILVPGMGDDVQTIKAGIMEIADIFVINKADHPGSERVEKEIRALQSLAARMDEWVPPVVKTVGTEGQGIKELAGAIENYKAHMQIHGMLVQRRIHNWEVRLVEMLRDTMLQRAQANMSEAELTRLAAEVAEHTRDPFSVVEEIANRSRQG